MSAPTAALSVLNFPESYTLEKEDIKSRSSPSEEGPRIFWKRITWFSRKMEQGHASERVLRVDYRQGGSLECHKALREIM